MGCGSSNASGDKGPSAGGAGADSGSAAGGGGGKGGQKRLLDTYNVGEMLGQGAFGIVYACKPIGQERDCAVKMVDKVETPVDKIKEEADMLQKMDHPNVIKCQDIFHEKAFVCIVMDRYQSDLVSGMQAHWQSRGRIPHRITSWILAQMIAPVEYLHSLSIIHRDIKGDNYLIDRDDIAEAELRIVLIDFGTALHIGPSDRLTQVCGTKLYWSPEFYQQDYSFKVDVWAVGVVLYGLLCERFPFRNETEANAKSVTFSKGTPSGFKELVKHMLAKKEAKRASAAEVVAHPILAGLVPKLEGASKMEEEDEVPPDQNDDAQFKESGADEGVRERRVELVGRMRAQSQYLGNVVAGKLVSDAHIWLETFQVAQTVNGTNSISGNVKYNWNLVEEFEMSGSQWRSSLTSTGHKPMQVTNTDKKSRRASMLTEEAATTFLREQLEAQGIDTKRFGQGEAKTLEELSGEVERGASTLMLDASGLDASGHKKLVRVVEMVALRICAPGEEEKYLIEVGEKYADDRERYIRRLPGAKKQPHENTKQVVERYVADFLQCLNEYQIIFDFDSTEAFEEETISPSYPGVMTTYRKEIIKGRIVATEDAGKACFQNNSELTHSGDMGGTSKTFKWLKKQQCDSEGIQYESPKDWTYSALVNAPVGMNVEHLTTYLNENKVDISQFGKGQAKTLEDLSKEMLKGECSLIKTPDGRVIRVVAPVLLKLINNQNGKLLVQAEQTSLDGQTITLNRLPGTKRRANENVFLTARRIVENNLRVNLNHVIFNTDGVEVFEEAADSLAYPGLPTQYEKRIITASLCV